MKTIPQIADAAFPKAHSVSTASAAPKWKHAARPIIELLRVAKFLASTAAGTKPSPTVAGFTSVGTYQTGTTSTDAKTWVFRRTAVAGDSSVTLAYGASLRRAPQMPSAIRRRRTLPPDPPLSPVARGQRG